MPCAASSSAAGSASAASPPVCSTSPCPETARIRSAAEPSAAAAARSHSSAAPSCLGAELISRARPSARLSSARAQRSRPTSTRTGCSSSSPTGSPIASWKTRTSPRRWRPAPRPPGRAPLAAQRLGERGHLQHRVPGGRGLLQQPHGQRAAPPPVAGPCLSAEQRAGEPVRLLGPHARHPQQLPGVLPQQLRGALAQGRGGRRGERGGGAAPRQHLCHLAHGALGGCGRCLGGHRGPPHRLGRGAPRRGPLLEHGGRRLLAALHGPYGGEQFGRRAAQLGAGLDRALPLRLAPLDPLPLQALRGQLRLGLGHLRALGGRAVVRAPRLLRVSGVLTACSSRDRDSGAPEPTRRRAPGRSRQED